MKTETQDSAWAAPLGDEPLCGIVGPTAVGKSALALRVAERASAEIVSLDSMQVYRGMDIGTAKPTPSERARVRHHMLDLVEPSERYAAHRFLRDLAHVVADARARGARLLFVGGTGLYLKVLTAGLFDGPDSDPALRAELEARGDLYGAPALHAELARVDPVMSQRLHPNDQKRIVRALEVFQQTGRPLSAWQTQWSASPMRSHLVGLTVETAELDRRIAARIETMLANGWPAEAGRIRDTVGFGPTAIQALGYVEALALHDGAIGHAAAARRIYLGTRQFARRQRTWFRKFEIDWHPPADDPRAEDALVAATLVRLGWSTT